MISRRHALEAVSGERFDVVVIGGGITGAGVALDAASRGYSVALVERGDYAIGTSSRSSKMVHGGLRYLQNFDIGLVREALLERQLMVRLAPHLVYPTPFLVPTLGEDRRERKYSVALNMYDVMASSRLSRGKGKRGRERSERDEDREQFWSPDRHRQISGEETLELLPALEPRKPSSAYLFYDCQTDDVRLVLTVLGEAERFGALMVNRVEVVELASDAGTASGVLCVDGESGERFEIAAANVVNATGVWADRLRPGEITTEEDVPRIRPSRGTHITVAYDDLPLRAACIVPAAGGRTIFALPWMGRTLVGTTDNDYEGDISRVGASGEDVEYLLEAVNSFFELDLGAGDLTGAYAGVRPLISTGDPKKSVDISRRAELYETSSGMLTITGGKLTTWRRMAEMVVDRMVERESREAPCRTADIPLGMPARAEDLSPDEGISDDALVHVAARYGHAARNVLALVGERPELGRPIVPGLPDLLAEAVIAARSEQARTVGDVLLRRTRLGLLAAPQLRSAESVLAVAEAIGGELGWDRSRIEKEAAGWESEAEAEGIDPASLASA